MFLFASLLSRLYIIKRPIRQNRTLEYKETRAHWLTLMRKVCAVLMQYPIIKTFSKQQFVRNGVPANLITIKIIWC